MKIMAIVQARMTSTRLPGKVLKKVGNKTLLEYQLERIKKSGMINEVVIATTTNETDLPIVELCNELNISVYRGSENDVLTRYYEASKVYGADIVVRLTSDCPLIDYRVIDEVIQIYLDNYPQIDYASNTLKRTYPRGMDTEVFSVESLAKAFNNATLNYQREHVTPYIYSNTNIFNIFNLASSNPTIAKYRWTVDTIEDFHLISKMISEIHSSKPDYSLQDLVNLIEENPEWATINKHVEQKKLVE